MVDVVFKSVGLDIPIYSANARSLKSKLIKNIPTGGILISDPKGNVNVKALDNLSFHLKEGDRLGLVGHNGAGKSTLLRVLCGVYKPTVGKVSINGSVIPLIDISLGINPEATGRENIFIRGALLSLSKATIEKNIEDIISFSELGSFIDMPLRTYSSGMQLRLAFAISTMVRSDILIMDEWLSVGDENFRAKADERMSKILEMTKILVVASHSREMIMKNCNRVIWLEHGKIKLDSTPENVCDAYFSR
jgi:lipopolysaccharide transport system ATP-binding protein